MPSANFISDSPSHRPKRDHHIYQDRFLSFFLSMSSNLFFSTFEVSRQAFYRSSFSYAIVNLKPIVPGRMSRSCLLELTQISLRFHHRCSCHTYSPCPSNRRPQWYQKSLDIFCATLLIGSFIASELVSLMHSVQRVGTIIERAYGADALTVACQASSHLCLF